MKRLMLAVLSAVIVSPAVAQDDCKKACGKCGQEKFGTTLQWKGSPNEAATEAKKQEKLLFVLHVSGNFEDPKFT